MSEDPGNEQTHSPCQGGKPARAEPGARRPDDGNPGAGRTAGTLLRHWLCPHGDVEKLIEWQAIVKDEQGRIIAPYSEIVVDVLLPHRSDIQFEDVIA